MRYAKAASVNAAVQLQKGATAESVSVAAAGVEILSQGWLRCMWWPACTGMPLGLVVTVVVSLR